MGKQDMGKLQKEVNKGKAQIHTKKVKVAPKAELVRKSKLKLKIAGEKKAKCEKSKKAKAAAEIKVKLHRGVRRDEEDQERAVGEG